MKKKKFDTKQLENITWNYKMQPILRLGRVAACWDIVEGIWGAEDEKTRPLVAEIMTALQAYDDVLRERLRKQGW